MSSTIETLPRPSPRLESIVIESDQHLLLSNVSWEDYLAIGAALAERGNLRLTYDQGRLEFMTLSTLHELVKYLLGRLVDLIAEELDIAINGFGQMTHQRPDLAKSLEPDACYYIK